MPQKSPYNKLAPFYDNIIGRSKNTPKKTLVRKYKKQTQSILELGCGTGLVFEQFKDVKKLTGVDLSSAMLEVAERKRPFAEFVKADITGLKLKETFDCVLCVYDTINHIQYFTGWIKVFKVAYEHLVENGLFILDMNTIAKLEFLSEENPVALEYKNGYFIFDIVKKRKYLYDWYLKIFEKRNDGKFELTKQTITEVSFDILKVTKSLSKYFDILDILDENIKFRATDESFRVYFICKKKKI